jgi:DNA-binding NtrC family response regulator
MKGARILLVDDEAVFRRSLAARLGLRGYSVVEAGGGEEALALIRKDEAIELVIIDSRMPGLSGAQTVAELARLRPGMPVIALTGMQREEARARLGRATVFAVLEKPCEFERLLETVDAALRGNMPNLQAGPR